MACTVDEPGAPGGTSTKMERPLAISSTTRAWLTSKSPIPRSKSGSRSAGLVSGSGSKSSAAADLSPAKALTSGFSPATGRMVSQSELSTALETPRLATSRFSLRSNPGMKSCPARRIASRAGVTFNRPSSKLEAIMASGLQSIWRSLNAFTKTGFITTDPPIFNV